MPAHPCSLRLPPGGMDCWEDSPAGAYGLRLAWCTHLASCRELQLVPGAPFLRSGGFAPLAENRLPQGCCRHQMERGPPWCQEAGASGSPLAPAPTQEWSHIKPAGAEFPAAPGRAGCKSHKCDGLLKCVCKRVGSKNGPCLEASKRP